MDKEKKLIVAALVTAVLLLVALLVTVIVKKLDDARYIFPDKQEEVIKSAPDFTAELISGGEFTLSENLGKPVLINFWATWCGPCCEEMPAFERLKADYGDAVAIVAVNCGEKADVVKEFVKENGYTFDFAIDENAHISTDLYPTMSIPYTVLIDAEGKIAEEFVGAYSAERQYKLYKNAIEKVLNETK